VDASVVICTRNREASLTRVLASMAELAVPEELVWELLVVDNGSTDRTAEIVEGFVHSLPIRRVLEPKAGLSHARNRGIAEARGDYIVWTDDDVLVHRGWLAAYVAAFRRHPSATFFGGRIDPMLEPPTPPWFQENLDLLAGLTVKRDFGPNELTFSLEGDSLPFGANYAVRAADQRRFPYDVRLGVSPAFRRSGEETAVLRALLRSGCVGWWVPDAIITHVLPPTRQTSAHVVDHFRALGQTWAYLNDTGSDNFLGSPYPVVNTFRGVPRWIYRKAAEHLFRAFIARPASKEWLIHLTKYGYYRGAIGYWATKQRAG
jgi:glycosyltransferase involved in cell wall biosynthesis